MKFAQDHDIHYMNPKLRIRHVIAKTTKSLENVLIFFIFLVTQTALLISLKYLLF